MAKSKNHTSHNQNRKDHRNGIHRPMKHRKVSLKGVSSPPTFHLYYSAPTPSHAFPDGRQVLPEHEVREEAQQEAREEVGNSWDCFPSFLDAALLLVGLARVEAPFGPQSWLNKSLVISPLHLTESAELKKPSTFLVVSSRWVGCVEGRVGRR